MRHLVLLALFALTLSCASRQPGRGPLDCGTGRTAVWVNDREMCVSQPYADLMTCPIPQALKSEIQRATSEAAGGSSLGVGVLKVGLDAEYKSVDETVKVFMERGAVEQDAERLRVVACTESFKKQMDRLEAQPQSAPKVAEAPVSASASGGAPASKPSSSATGTSMCEGGERWIEITELSAQAADNSLRIVARVRAKTAKPVTILFQGNGALGNAGNGQWLLPALNMFSGFNWSGSSSPQDIELAHAYGFPLTSEPTPLWFRFETSERPKRASLRLPLLVTYTTPSGAVTEQPTEIECSGIPVVTPLEAEPGLPPPTEVEPATGPQELSCYGMGQFLEVTRARGEYANGRYRVGVSLRSKLRTDAAIATVTLPELFDTQGRSAQNDNAAPPPAWWYRGYPDDALRLLESGLPLLDTPTLISMNFDSPTRAARVTLLMHLQIAYQTASGNPGITQGSLACQNVPID